ncbi:E3 ubiquitin-protein ligase RNF13 isoform X1 [Anopheles stephensi]|uniref:E3 ubiquitin-protein ligase RNF13 isoform X1 n=1 Tax=Anopheles stephensi TaxID=30069 RepID=UPI001658BD28|nr:E3 ubiquitin-protein ligase RNF13 isoform X1 [Anopheles stephensi]XP_035897288.1 E3 ubiquitin-protein ligase RNF13 isoform X1 [Anopheles stephensi]XP_035897289.1 E3 ubiquitin-protein ligase RNF13 isoform X1 [Anopheles stephensi]XP_035897290.1 E3 ubiquitin-protein ligase RNF13 isoform X1 [Anopheles stephensi]XP_035897291.1 E3 ubiquitin-protein ligase RNF13 isoform X1 [Anopheles stephensi]XP_035897293.1 E3 ubiquitin-protein ligase RNF13 isoform X1 [Anopheles stephensi]XP_035897294.1 E3 ubiqu
MNMQPAMTVIMSEEQDGSERLQQNGRYQHRPPSKPPIANRRTHRLVLLVAMMLLMLQLIPCAKADILVYQMLNDQIIEEFRDLPATFGGEIPDSGLKVLADKSDPPDGCTEMRPAPNVTSKFAVVIARYNCSFEVKVRNAQQAGYAMVIVHNVGSNDLEHMSANHPQDLLIPSVFVGESSGRSIIEAYLYDRDYALVITDDIPFNISNNLIIPFAIVVGLCFIIMRVLQVLFMIIRCIRERRRRMRHRLPARVLRRIGIVKFAKGMRFDVCAICLEDFVENERLRVLPCRHAYHAICIDPWLTKNRRVCPICKRRVIVRGETRQRRYSSDSMSSTNADESTPLLNSTDSSATVGGGGAAVVVTAPPVTSSSTPAAPAGTGAVPPPAPPQREEQQTQQHAPPSSHVMEVPASDDDDELLDDRNVPSARWLLRGRATSQQQQQQQQQQQPPNESPYTSIGDNVVVPLSRWRFFQRFFSTQSSTAQQNDAIAQQESGSSSSQPTTPLQQAPSSLPVSPTAAPVGTGNNILNAQLSGSFHGSEDTTDDELLDAMHRHRAKQAQVRSAPDMPSTSMGARLGVAALPNVNFNPGGGLAAPTELAPAGPGNNRRGPGNSRRAPRRSPWWPEAGGNNNNHIV